MICILSFRFTLYIPNVDLEHQPDLFKISSFKKSIDTTNGNNNNNNNCNNSNNNNNNNNSQALPVFRGFYHVFQGPKKSQLPLKDYVWCLHQRLWEGHLVRFWTENL